MHCIDKHQFPRNYDFFIINDGIDRRNSMLRSTHRRRSSTLDSTDQRKGGPFAGAGAGDAMDVVHDEAKAEAHPQVEHGSRASHLKLRGRGGFSHPSGSGRNRGNDRATSDFMTVSTDPVDSLASSMSALHFVPHSVRMARGKGRGRGG